MTDRNNQHEGFPHGCRMISFQSRVRTSIFGADAERRNVRDDLRVEYCASVHHSLQNIAHGIRGTAEG